VDARKVLSALGAMPRHVGGERFVFAACAHTRSPLNV
jgi:hypothetical protein